MSLCTSQTTFSRGEKELWDVRRVCSRSRFTFIDVHLEYAYRIWMCCISERRGRNSEAKEWRRKWSEARKNELWSLPLILNITALWNSGRHVDVSEEPAACMDSTFVLPDNRGDTVDWNASEERNVRGCRNTQGRPVVEGAAGTWCGAWILWRAPSSDWGWWGEPQGMRLEWETWETRTKFWWGNPKGLTFSYTDLGFSVRFPQL